ncbi:MAG: hypothetical protein QM757_14290 [Paludibaculum sp.]
MGIETEAGMKAPQAFSDLGGVAPRDVVDQAVGEGSEATVTPADSVVLDQAEVDELVDRCFVMYRAA